MSGDSMRGGVEGRSGGTARARRRQRGNTAILMAILVVVLFGSAALAFDLSYVRLARFHLQNANDASAHAAIVQLRKTGSMTTATQAAQSVGRSNSVGFKPLTVAGDDITYGRWNYKASSFTPGSVSPNAVRVDARRIRGAADGPLDVFFGHVLGTDHADARQSGIAALPARDLIIAQDITGSFVGSGAGNSPIDDAVAADVTFLTTLRDQAMPSDRIGMVLFTGVAYPLRVGSPDPNNPGAPVPLLQYVQAEYQTIYDEWRGDGRSAFDNRKASGVTVCNKLDVNPTSTAPWNHRWVPACSGQIYQGGRWVPPTIVPPNVNGDGTNMGDALRQAVMTLVNGEAIADDDQRNHVKVIVLVTDGEPQCCYATPSFHCSTSDACARGRAANGNEAADLAASNNISIFTVTFGKNPIPSSQIQYNAGLVRGFGQAFVTANSKDLAAILQTIAKRIPVSIVR